VGTTTASHFDDYRPDSDHSDRCAEPITFSVEEPARAEFFSQSGKVPGKAEAIRLRPEPENGRLVVEASAGLAIGLVPTRLGYLMACQAKGFRYEGFVEGSSVEPIPRVDVTISAKPPG
jgi:hypothetical protein